MMRLTSSCVLVLALVACDARQAHMSAPTPAPTQMLAPTPVPTSNVTGPTITLGVPIRDTFIGNPQTYVWTATSDGTLVVRVTWDPTVEYAAKLMLTLGDCATPHPIVPPCPSAVTFRASAPNWSPVVGRIAVSARQTYRVVVEEGQAPWDYGFNQPFELTAAVER